MSGHTLVERIVRAEGLAYESAQTGDQIEALGELFAPILADVRELERDSARLAFIVDYNWIGTKTRCEQGIQDGDLASTRAAIDTAILTKCAKETTA